MRRDNESVPQSVVLFHVGYAVLFHVGYAVLVHVPPSRQVPPPPLHCQVPPLHRQVPPLPFTSGTPTPPHQGFP